MSFFFDAHLQQVWRIYNGVAGSTGTKNLGRSTTITRWAHVFNPQRSTASNPFRFFPLFEASKSNR